MAYLPAMEDVVAGVPKLRVPVVAEAWVSNATKPVTLPLKAWLAAPASRLAGSAT